MSCLKTREEQIPVDERMNGPSIVKNRENNEENQRRKSHEGRLRKY